jgi:endonuclease/exonuclease/phosphatase (EEP) superfamily protein YafD
VLPRVIVLFVAALVAMPCAAVSGSRLLGGVARTPIPQFAAFAPWAILGWLVVLLLLLCARWWWFAVVVLVLLAVQATWVLPDRGAQAATGARPGAVALRVMTINVYVGAADVAELLGLARKNDVDLLAVQEATPEFVERLGPGLSRQLPHLVRSEPNFDGGTLVWSRWPITPLGPPLGEGHKISRMLLRVPGAVPVTVTGVHTMSPGRGRIDGWTRDLQAITRVSAQTTGPQVLIGDFNASRDHGPFRQLLATGVVDGAEAIRTPPWRGVTWPAGQRLFPVAVRLDHVMVSPGSIGVRELRLLEVPGTDHRGVLADLEIQPARTDQREQGRIGRLTSSATPSASGRIR